MVALSARGTISVRILDEPFPLVRKEPLDLLGCEPVPYARIDLGHLWLLDDLHTWGGSPVRGRMAEERPGGMVGPSAS